MQKTNNQKKQIIILISIFSWVAFFAVSFVLFPRFENVNYYNLISDFSISCIALFLLYSINIYGNKPFYKTLAYGYYLLFVSYYIDSIDQIFIHSIAYTVIMEKLTLIASFLLIYTGSKQWMKDHQVIALTDDLTQLPNRKLTKQRIESLIESNKNKPSVFSLIIIDIDFFKKLNDKYGHLNGDSILSQFATLIDSSLKSNEILGRWGGEEFIMIKKNINKKTAVLELETLRKNIEKHAFILDDVSVKLTASFGVSEYSNMQHDFKSRFIEADKAMYKAKNSGRNRIN